MTRTRVALIAVVALLLGGLLGWSTTKSTEGPVGRHEVRLGIGGNGQIDYMATVHAGRVEIAEAPTVEVRSPGAAIMTVRAESGQDKIVVCQLFVDGVLRVQQQATDGGSATCVWTP